VFRFLVSKRLRHLCVSPDGSRGCVYCGSCSGYLTESVARVPSAVHSDVMSSSGADRYYWCLSHRRVETDANACAAVNRLGPYATAAEAERALDRVRDRNEAWDAEDARWTGEQP
jgi:hypothetical protein